MRSRLATIAIAVMPCLALPSLVGAQEHGSGASFMRPALALGSRHGPGNDPLAAERAAIRVALRRSRWREGAVIGAVLFGATGGVLAAGFCGANDSASANGCTADIVGGTLLGVAIGGVFGGLIGAQIHRDEPRGE